MEEELEVSSHAVFGGLKHIGTIKKLEKWEPKEFNDWIVTSDGKWNLYDNRRRSRQWLGTDEPTRNFPMAKTHKKTTMVTVWRYSLEYYSLKYTKEEASVSTARLLGAVEDLTMPIQDILDDSQWRSDRGQRTAWNTPKSLTPA
nr:histone-lysine N-methyltransferase SETMAR-like [Leptinotarsa decemlineata]